MGDSIKCRASMFNEGITVKGQDVSQQYTYGNIGTLEAEISTIVLQLKGKTVYNESVKTPIAVKTRLKCSTCGRRNKSTNKYCYNCGTYLL